MVAFEAACSYVRDGGRGGGTDWTLQRACFNEGQRDPLKKIGF